MAKMQLASGRPAHAAPLRIRKRVNGTGERPRLVVYRSLKHIYAQLVDDVLSAR